MKAAYVRNALGPHEAIIEYLVTSDRLFTFVATRDTVVALTRAIGIEDLANRVRLATELSAKSKTATTGAMLCVGCTTFSLHRLIPWPR